MYGLAVNLIMSVSGHPSIINEINHQFTLAATYSNTPRYALNFAQKT